MLRWVFFRYKIIYSKCENFQLNYFKNFSLTSIRNLLLMVIWRRKKTSKKETKSLIRWKIYFTIWMIHYIVLFHQGKVCYHVLNNFYKFFFFWRNFFFTEKWKSHFYKVNKYLTNNLSQNVGCYQHLIKVKIL